MLSLLLDSHNECGAESLIEISNLLVRWSQVVPMLVLASFMLEDWTILKVLMTSRPYPLGSCSISA